MPRIPPLQPLQRTRARGSRTAGWALTVLLAAPFGAQGAELAAPGDCAKARDLEIRQEPVSGTVKQSETSTGPETVSGSARRHFRGADVAASAVETVSAGSVASLATPAPRAFAGPGPCDTPGSGCGRTAVVMPAVSAAPSPTPATRRTPRVTSSGKGKGGRQCDRAPAGR